MEASTVGTLKLHLKHIGETIGDRFPLRELGFSEVQRHLDRRSAAKYRGRPIGPVTMRKEVTTLKAAWSGGDPLFDYGFAQVDPHHAEGVIAQPEIELVQGRAPLPRLDHGRTLGNRRRLGAEN